MSDETLLNPAERAEKLAAQTVDEEVKKTLLDAAREYRETLKTEQFAPKSDWKLPKEIS